MVTIPISVAIRGAALIRGEALIRGGQLFEARCLLEEIRYIPTYMCIYIVLVVALYVVVLTTMVIVEVEVIILITAFIFFMCFFSLGKLLIANIGMVFASIFLFVGLIISIMTKCKQFSENGYKVIAGILAGVVILGGMVFIYLIIL